MKSKEVEWRIDGDCQETFSFLIGCWSVTGAKMLLRDAPERETIQVNVEPFFRLLRSIVVEESKHEIDLKVPVIIISTSSESHMLIDGWHRLAKAKELGVTVLPAFVLDVKESHLIRIS